MPEVTNVKRHPGIAGQFAVSAEVTYEDEGTSHVEFVGNTAGGPVVMVTDYAQTFVTDPGRFGSFAAQPIEWVSRFFSDEVTS